MERQSDPYIILGIQHNASRREIHDAYSTLARVLHPDQRNKKQSPHEEMMLKVSSSNSNAILSDFTELNNANDVLSDEYRRMMYDTTHGVREYTAIEIARVQKLYALNQKELMTETYKLNTERERAKGGRGLIIISAFYGVFPKEVDAFDSINNQSLGETCDVTIPLQCLVEDQYKPGHITSQIICTDDGLHKHHFDGFYDPSPGNEKRLVIRYTYMGKLHQVVVGDLDPFTAPNKAHLKEAGKVTSFKKKKNSHGIPIFIKSGVHSNYLQMMKKRKRRNRLVLLGGTAFMFALLYKRKPKLLKDCGLKMRKLAQLLRYEINNGEVIGNIYEATVSKAMYFIGVLHESAAKKVFLLGASLKGLEN